MTEGMKAGKEVIACCESIYWFYNGINNSPNDVDGHMMMNTKSILLHSPGELIDVSLKVVNNFL